MVNRTLLVSAFIYYIIFIKSPSQGTETELPENINHLIKKISKTQYNFIKLSTSLMQGTAEFINNTLDDAMSFGGKSFYTCVTDHGDILTEHVANVSSSLTAKLFKFSEQHRLNLLTASEEKVKKVKENLHEGDLFERVFYNYTTILTTSIWDYKLDFIKKIDKCLPSIPSSGQKY